jgi:RpiR family carbohydrate utilization transcriptional regulator
MNDNIMPHNLLERLQSQQDQLSKSERRVAKAILADPIVAIRSSIATLAKVAEVSEPTVNRFCRSMQCTGFPDFKLHLAQCIATGAPYVSRDVEVNDDAKAYITKIFDGTLSALTDAQRSLNSAKVATAVDRLAKAKKIEFYGLGGSGSVVIDAQHKFFRLKTPVVAYTDVLMQRMSAAGSSKGDAIVMVSSSGRTKSLVETAHIARDAGAWVIGIAPPDSPLAKASNLSIDLETPEDTDIYTPMTSRILQLIVIDILATGVALKRGAEFQSHLKKIKDSIGDTRFAAPE